MNLSWQCPCQGDRDRKTRFHLFQHLLTNNKAIKHFQHLLVPKGNEPNANWKYFKLAAKGRKSSKLYLRFHFLLNQIRRTNSLLPASQHTLITSSSSSSCSKSRTEAEPCNLNKNDSKKHCIHIISFTFVL